MAVKSYVEHEGKNPYQCNLVQLTIPFERSHVFNTITDTADGTIDLNFEDGSEKKGFDLLVGADGIWSAIRAQMWGESTVKPGTCTYSGYTLFAAENVMEPASDFFADEGYFDAGYKVYIGPGKYFVTSDVGSGRILRCVPNVSGLRDDLGRSLRIASHARPDKIGPATEIYPRPPLTPRFLTPCLIPNTASIVAISCESEPPESLVQRCPTPVSRRLPRRQAPDAPSQF